MPATSSPPDCWRPISARTPGGASTPARSCAVRSTALRAVIWYADIRGFTPISDAAPGPVVIELLNDVFEILAAALRPRGGQVLKFIGDGMLATFSFEEPDRAATCRRALDAAIEAMRNSTR